MSRKSACGFRWTRWVSWRDVVSERNSSASCFPRRISTNEKTVRNVRVSSAVPTRKLARHRWVCVFSVVEWLFVESTVAAEFELDFSLNFCLFELKRELSESKRWNREEITDFIDCWVLIFLFGRHFADNRRGYVRRLMIVVVIHRSLGRGDQNRRWKSELNWLLRWIHRICVRCRQ